MRKSTITTAVSGEDLRAGKRVPRAKARIEARTVQSRTLLVGALVSMLGVCINTAVAVDWTPANMTTLVWLDAADTGTITADGGGAVSGWADKSGNGNNLAQANPDKRPTTGLSALNGKNVLDFDGTDDTFAWTIMVNGATTNTKSFWMVIEPDVVEARGPGRIDRNGGGAYQAFTENGAGIYSNVQNYWGTVNNTYKTTDAKIISLGMTQSNQPFLAHNGNVILGPVKVPKGANMFELSQVGSEFDGVIAEVIMCDSPDDETRYKIEGYLAWKWGLQAGLPSGHAYESSAPEGPAPSTPGTFIYGN